ncbi:type IV pilus assembly protein PilB [Desulfacinum hydrothermale DSM 13146]|uniref:Type IV pilus assembly protein PilB n=1 Tax=Desulfacinum hydrothermale DSM 13146 TaxID=1121390 RepID=A0A1W1X6G5_9BACT|nr:type IV-A pilus assembly ATPase PilB [Desulfacinum hydrothermale]SMC19559.1 type IV pilus assembly protein PilB [Desulfacinum hydrothermale DSM 13146]
MSTIKDSAKSRATSLRNKIGQLLVNAGLISSEDLEEALREQARSGERLGAVLIRKGLIDEKILAEFLAKQFRVPVVNPAAKEIPKKVLELLPLQVIQKYQVVPLALVGNTLHLATPDPGNLFVIDDVRFITQKNVRVHVAPEGLIQQTLEHLNAGSQESLEEVMGMIQEETGDVDLVESSDEIDLANLENAAGEAPVVKLVNLILLDAIRKKASDIHVECYEKKMRVRYRIDGVLYEVMNPPFQLRNAIISRLKIMSRLDIAERRLPQDGRIKLRAKGGEMEFRVSVLPTLFGEKVVLRLLDKSNLQLDMTKLGFEPKQLDAFREAIYRPYGMVLVTGPTGSGKTTTLYSALSELNQVSHNISTAEDPVEFSLPGINQVQVHESIGLNFAAALRSFLRQDPDIIMVGEIRDFETAEVAIKAALTGHLVLSTLHTNDAPSTVNRLLNMGVEPFLVASAVNLILAQRLARKVCPECKVEEEVRPEALLDLGVPEQEVGTFKCYRGRGCMACSNTGYRGRIALYEVMPMTDPIRDLVLVGASASEIKEEAIRQGMLTLRMSGINKLKEGITSVEEVIRSTVKD